MAGGGRAGDALPALRRFAIQRGWNVEICIPGSASDLADKARIAVQNGRRRIFVLGGDGTFQLVLNAVADQPNIILAVIPAGGGNDLAAALGLPPDPLQAASLFLDGEVGYLDAVRVRTADGTERLYSGGGGVGLDAEAARHANNSYSSVRGRLRYLLSAIRALLGFRAFHTRITLCAGNEQPLEATALLVAVLNTPSYGGGFCLSPTAKTDDGTLELIVLEDLSTLEILRLLPAFVSRGMLNTNKIRRVSVNHVRIDTDSPLWFHGDGELLGMTPVEITVVPRAVRILRPAAKTNR
jgi:diacylglycerol kinase (ATP)